MWVGGMQTPDYITMTPFQQSILFALAEVRSVGKISAERQMRLLEQDLNPEYVQRSCILFLDEECNQDNVPSGAAHIYKWCADLQNEMAKK